MANPFQLGFLDATSPIMEKLLHFHDHTLIITFKISSLALCIISLILTTYSCTHNRCTSRDNLDHVPAIIRILIALSSLQIFYMIHEISNPSLNVKTVGHQWYWSYEHTDYEDLKFYSSIIPTLDLKPELWLIQQRSSIVIEY